MTFTFTLDAFPDYTKFDRTHKVLAALQVIEDKYEDEVEEREACVPFDYDVLTYGVTASYDNDSTDERVKMTVTGSNVNGFGYDTDNWGTALPNDIQLAEINFAFPVENGKEYKLISHSPLYQYYYKDDGTGDPNIKKSTDGSLYKEQTKRAEGELWTVTTGIINKKGTVDFALYEVTGNDESLVKAVVVKNDISFAKKCIVKVTDVSNKMSDRAVNEVSVDNFDKVVVGDTLCFKAAGTTEVTVDGKVINPDSMGIYTAEATKASIAITVA